MPLPVRVLSVCLYHSGKQISPATGAVMPKRRILGALSPGRIWPSLPLGLPPALWVIGSQWFCCYMHKHADTLMQHTQTQEANPVNSHLHFGLSVVPLCNQQQLNLIAPKQKHFPLGPSLSLFLSQPFNLISGNVKSGCFAQSPRPFS